MADSLRLHIGGKQAHPDWKILDIEDRPEVDFVCNALDLSQFADDSVDQIYASHVLEHFHYSLENELVRVLTEWKRVLKPEGELLISVPDLKTLCWLYLNPQLSVVERHFVMEVMFGGQTNQYDIHRVGLDFDTLGWILQSVGFQNYLQVPEFGLFDDCSSMRVFDILISLNVVAQKPTSISK